MNLGLVNFKPGTYKYGSSRDNNFSNRAVKASLSVLDAATEKPEPPMNVRATPVVNEAAPAAAKRAAGPVFRPAQTEKEIEARRSSHAYLMQQLEQEPWVKAQLHTPGSDASGMARERLFGE